MDSKEFIQNVLRTEAGDTPAIKARLSAGNTYREVHASMGAATEVGELVDIFKRKIFYDKPVDRTNLIEETGDVLWYLAVLAHEYEFTFEEAMDAVIAKLKIRFPAKFTTEQALNRNLADEVVAMKEQIKEEEKKEPAKAVAVAVPVKPSVPKAPFDPERVVYTAPQVKRSKEELDALEKIR